MNSNLVRKAVCLIVIMAMVLTTFAVIPIGIATNDGTSRYKVNGSVYYAEPYITPIGGASVVLYNLHTGERRNTVTDDGAYSFKDVAPGHYQVYVRPPSNNYQTTPESISMIEVKGNIAVNLILTYIPNEPKSTLSGIVVDNETNPIKDAVVTLKSDEHSGYKVSSNNTNATGEFTIETFRGEYELWATALGFHYNVTSIILNTLEITNYSIMLDRGEYIISGIIDLDPLPEVETPRNIFLFDIDNNETIQKETTSFLNIKAYPGNFTLLIDAPGYMPYYYPNVIELGPSTNMSFKLENPSPKLIKTNDENIVTTLSFPGNNWDTITYSSTWTLNHDSEVYGLKYVDFEDFYTPAEEPITVGCPRFQIDMEPAFGGIKEGIVGGEVEVIEVTGFTSWLKDRGPYWMYTNGFFEINNASMPGFLAYGWDKTSLSVNPNEFVGTFGATDQMTITTNLNYDLIQPEDPLDATNFKIKFGTLRENEVIDFTLPSGYELSGTSAYNKDAVWVQAFNKCQINSSAVTITAAELLEPEAFFEVLDDYVNKLVNITFNGSESDPGSGTISNYTWDLGDGTTKYGQTVEHNYTTANIYKATLKVTTTANLVNEYWTNITVDTTDPEPVIEFQNETGFTITEGKENTPQQSYNITFNASKSRDTIDKIKPGKIVRYKWDFGDERGVFPEGITAEYSYADPGTYEVKLNITDEAGHYTEITKDLVILDLEAPQPQLIWKEGRICDIDKYIILNASGTVDNPGGDTLENLTFAWDLDTTKDGPDDDNFPENDVDATGVEVNFTPERLGPHPIALWVTDTAGNTANTTDLSPDEWRFEVVGMDLHFASVKEELDKFIEVSKKTPKEGEKVKFTINITNSADVTAYDVLVTFKVDGKQKSTKTIGVIHQYDFYPITFTWKASGVKTHNISFNISYVNSNNATFETDWDDNDRSQQLEVQAETFIETPCLVAVIIIVIIVIIVIIYFYRRRQSELGDLGKRREKGKGKGKGKGKDKKEKKEKTQEKKSKKKGKKEEKD